MKLGVPLLALWLAIVPSAATSQCPNGSPPPCAPRTTPAAPATNSVAVLYFDARDTSDAFLAEGVSEEIATSLGRVPRLAVKIPSAVRRVQTANAGDVRAIGRALNVRWVVDGSLRRSGEQLRVSVRLVDAERETAAWSSAFTRTTRDLLAIQEEIAREVATGVVGALTPVERPAVTSLPTRNAAAYEHYLRGNWYLGRRGQWLTRAAAEYQTAARLDPAFGAARAGLALVYLSEADYGTGGSRADSLRDIALALADSVIQRDPSVALAWVARGAVERRLRRFAAGRQSIERALALDPNSSEAYFRLGQSLSNVGRYPEARVALRKSLALDPSRAVSYQLLGTLAYFDRRYADAISLLDSALAVDPDYRGAIGWQAVVTYAMGDTARGERLARRHGELLRLQRAATGDTGPPPGTTVLDLNMVGRIRAQSLALAGRLEEALALLQEPLYPECRWVIQDPAFDPVRRDSRFVRYEAACLALQEPQ